MMQDNSQDSLSAVLKPAASARFRPQPALLVSALALLVAAGFGAYQFRAVQNLKAEISRNDKVKFDLQAMQQNAATRQQQLEARFTLIEERQTEAHNQQAALGAMYEALTRSDTVRILAEIEQTLTFASQQLQLTGNIPAAQATLASIDQKLAQLNRPELISLRQSLAKDTDALKALPAVDLSGIILKLDNLASSLDKLPLAIDNFRATPPAPPKTEGDWLTRVATELWHELKQLIQIRRMDRPDAMLLSPEQAFFVRENIKLRLMDARTALLLRDETTYRADLKAVLNHLKQHFEARAAQTVSAAKLVEQLASQPLALKLPDLGGSLAAARNARSVAERTKP